MKRNEKDRIHLIEALSVRYNHADLSAENNMNRRVSQSEDGNCAIRVSTPTKQEQTTQTLHCRRSNKNAKKSVGLHHVAEHIRCPDCRRAAALIAGMLLVHVADTDTTRLQNPG